MKDKIKTISVITCLSFTCFLTQCYSCQKTDPVTKKILPGQELYSISCGFPSQIFEVVVLSSSDDGYSYSVRKSEFVAVSVAVNSVMVIAASFFILYLLSRRHIKLNRFVFVTLIIIMLFDLSLLVPFINEFFRSFLIVLYIYPVWFISSVLEFLKIDLHRNNIAPRIYLVLSIFIVYHLVSLAVFIKKRFTKQKSPSTS